jgi:hypothetical protein
MTVSISLAWSRSDAMSIEPLAGAHVRANSSNSTMIASRFAKMKSDRHAAFPLEEARDRGSPSFSRTKAGPRVAPLAGADFERGVMS